MAVMGSLFSTLTRYIGSIMNQWLWKCLYPSNKIWMVSSLIGYTVLPDTSSHNSSYLLATFRSQLPSSIKSTFSMAFSKHFNKRASQKSKNHLDAWAPSGNPRYHRFHTIFRYRRESYQGVCIDVLGELEKGRQGCSSKKALRSNHFFAECRPT